MNRCFPIVVPVLLASFAGCGSSVPPTPPATAAKTPTVAEKPKAAPEKVKPVEPPKEKPTKDTDVTKEKEKQGVTNSPSGFRNDPLDNRSSSGGGVPSPANKDDGQQQEHYGA